jgi:hypothetical protein
VRDSGARGRRGNTARKGEEGRVDEVNRYTARHAWM